MLSRWILFVVVDFIAIVFRLFPSSIYLLLFFRKISEDIVLESGSDCLMQSVIDKANYETQRSKTTDREIGMTSSTYLWLKEQWHPNQIFTTSRNFSFCILTGENVPAFNSYYCSQKGGYFLMPHYKKSWNNELKLVDFVSISSLAEPSEEDML